APTTPAASGAEPAPTASEPAADTREYLQVGAYREQANTDPVVKALTDAGYRVTVRVDSGLTRVLVGPVAQPEQPRVVSDLQARGFDPIATK
ncbi:MAG TPA: SPOR domain-containing protein, partial [Deinococcales bacterium]|nr:SPOR domain-containing protein [Deinococcales bacterium]